MDRRSFIAGLGLSPLAAVSAIAAPVPDPVLNGTNDVDVYLGSGSLLGNEHVNPKHVVFHEQLADMFKAYDRALPSRLADHMSRRG